jgi:hypothetical protein
MLVLLLACTGAAGAGGGTGSGGEAPDTGTSPDSGEPPDTVDSGDDSGAGCPPLGEGGRWDDAPPVVIGGGLAGLAAALDLDGAVILEANDTLGGRGGEPGFRRWRFVGTDAQAAFGEDASAAATFAEWERMTGSAGTSTTRTMLEDSPAVMARLEGLGLHFDRPSTDLVTGRHELFRTLEQGPDIAAAFAAALPPTAEVRLGTAATGLVFDDAGVAGVETAAGIVATRRVLIASGGFADGADLLREVTAWPLDTLALLEGGGGGWAVDRARSLCLGTDTLSAIGAMPGRLGGMGDGNAGAFAAEPPVIWVNPAGARFAREGLTGSVQSESLWDANLPAPVLTTAEGVRAAAADGQADAFVAALRCYADFDTLAAAEGIDAAGLRATLADVARYRAGEADPFGRDSADLPDLSGTPCAAEPGRLPQKSYGGLAVDEAGRVLSGDGDVVPGLWAAGESAGMAAPGVGGRFGFDGSLTAVVWSGWRAAASMRDP